MNRFLKLNFPWLSLLGLAAVIVVLAYIFRPKFPEYEIDAQQTMNLMNNPQLEVSPQAINIQQLIDIRSADEFAKGHPENAINVPVRNLLDDESLELFDRLQENGQEAVIYGNSELQATAPWLMLQQLGYGNVKLLKGSVSSANELIPTEMASTEVMLLDTAAMHVVKEVVKKPEVKTPKVVIPVRKEASSGGGC